MILDTVGLVLATVKAASAAEAFGKANNKYARTAISKAKWKELNP